MDAALALITNVLVGALLVIKSFGLGRSVKLRGRVLQQLAADPTRRNRFYRSLIVRSWITAAVVPMIAFSSADLSAADLGWTWPGGDGLDYLVDRFATPGHFASWNGTAPLDASSGEQQRHRLSRAGNRRINRILHIMAIVHLRHDTPGRAYYRRRLAEGKTPLEAIRALKRRLSDVVYRNMINDGKPARTGPGGQSGATLQSSAADLIPTADSSDKSLPGPATDQCRAPLPVGS